MAIKSNRDRRDFGRSLKMMKDEELVEIVKKGIPEAYQVLADRYDLLVRSVVGKYLRRDPMAAEDACQEAFLKALVRIKALRDPSRFKSWLCAIAHNQALDTIRKRKRVVSVALSGAAAASNTGDPDDVNQLMWQIPDKRSNPYEAHARTEVIGIMKDILEEIPDLYRDPISLRYNEGLDYQEIADVLEKPLGTIKSLIHRGKALIRDEVARRSGGVEGALVFAAG